MIFNWNEEKNKLLKENRNICFEDLIYKGKILGISKNGSKNHLGQNVLHILYDDYVYKIPFVTENNGEIFLKTAFKSRKLNKFYGVKNDK